MRLTSRDAATKRVMKSLARSAALSPLKVRSEDGSSPVVIALPDDLVREVEQKIRKQGGRANVIVAYESKLSVLSVQGDTMQALERDGSPLDMHADSTIEMLVEYLRVLPTKSTYVVPKSLRGEPLVLDLAYAGLF